MATRRAREDKLTDVAELFAARVPRYTSYPTAPHFHEGIGEVAYRAWLGALDPGSPLSLYVHIPFCDTLCWFCGCHTTVVTRYAPVDSYCDVLLQEIGLVSAAIDSSHSVIHIHWGGGSPTILSVADVQRVNAALREKYHIASDAEFAVEIDPRGFGKDMAAALASAGLTRASIGIQDCDPIVQRAINRNQTPEETAQAAAHLRAVGVESLNIDLIYGLPHQTVDGLRRTIDFAVSLAPDRLAVFGYAHVPHFKKHMALIPESALPGLELRFEQYEAVRAQLIAHGYMPIGLDHFARPGDGLATAQAEGSLARNFQGYTTDIAPALIGLGASAIGSLPQGYVQNIPGVPAWRNSVRAGRLPVARGVALTGDDKLRRFVIERLMCDLTVDLREAADLHGASPDRLAGALERLAPLIGKGVVAYDGAVLTVPETWRSAVRIVCAAFDAYLEPLSTQVRHAQAV